MAETDLSPLPTLDLSGRVIVVTGASEGIGRRLAIDFTRAGARVVLSSRRRDKLEDVAETIKKLGGTAHVVPVDIGKIDELSRWAAEIADLVSTDDKLILLNNAGFGYTRMILDTTEEEWDKLFGIHVKGTFFAAQKLAPLMIERGYGKIINMSSAWSEATQPGKVAYCAAKTAISKLTAGMSTEWAPMGIRTNALAPTTTLTEFTAKVMEQSPERAAKNLSHIPLGRFATPRDLVGAGLFLASEASDFMTGHTLFVDGGWSANQV